MTLGAAIHETRTDGKILTRTAFLEGDDAACITLRPLSVRYPDEIPQHAPLYLLTAVKRLPGVFMVVVVDRDAQARPVPAEEVRAADPELFAGAADCFAGFLEEFWGWKGISRIPFEILEEN